MAAKGKGDDLDRQMESLRLRHLPPQVVDPWRARAAREVPGWDASIRPLLEVPYGDGQVIYTLRAQGRMGTATHSVEVASPNQEEAIAQAKTFVYYWEHIEELM